MHQDQGDHEGERVSFVLEAGRLFSLSCKSLSSPRLAESSFGIGMESKATWWLRAYTLDPEFTSYTHIAWLRVHITRMETINIPPAMGF